MDPSHAWWVRLAAQLLTALLSLLLTAGLLWRLRARGAWTVLLALPVMAVLLVPASIYTYHHDGPVAWGVFGGLMNGCTTAMAVGWLLHSFRKRE